MIHPVTTTKLHRIELHLKTCHTSQLHELKNQMRDAHRLPYAIGLGSVISAMIDLLAINKITADELIDAAEDAAELRAYAAIQYQKTLENDFI